jgi:hypothetical protein
MRLADLGIGDTLTLWDEGFGPSHYEVIQGPYPWFNTDKLAVTMICKHAPEKEPKVGVGPPTMHLHGMDDGSYAWPKEATCT